MGLELARGRHVAYLGHDDVWYPSHLAMLTKAAQETDADLIGRVGDWRDYRTLRIPPDHEFILRAYDYGARFAAVNALTVFKFNSAWRRNSYQDKPSHEQTEYVRRIQEDRDFLADELLEIAAAYALNRPRSPITVIPKKLLRLMPPGWQVNRWRRIRGGTLYLTRSPASKTISALFLLMGTLYCELG